MTGYRIGIGRPGRDRREARRSSDLSSSMEASSDASDARCRPYGFLLLLTLAMVVATAGVALLTLHAIERALVRATGNALALVATEVSQELDRILYERYGDVQFLANVIGAHPKDEARTIARHLRWMKESYPVYLWLGVTDASGRIVAATADQSVGHAWNRSSWFLAIQEHGTIHVGDVEPFGELDGGMDTVSFTAPIRDAENTFQGALTARVSIQALEEVVTQTLRIVQERHTTFGPIEYQVLDSTGEAFVDSDLYHKGFVNLRRLGLPSAQVRVSHEPGYVEEVHLRTHDPMITGYASTHGYRAFHNIGWTVLLRMRAGDVLAPIRTIVAQLGLAGMVVVLPLLTLLLWMQGRLRKEWSEAQADKQRARAAEEALRVLCHDLDERVQERTAQLADTNDHLQAEIADRRGAEQALQRAKETLEERVQARTEAMLIYQHHLRSLASELRRTEERVRHRLATDLHDNLAQTLAFCKMKLEALVQARTPQPPGVVLEDLAVHVAEALQCTRELMYDLRPVTLGDGDDLPSAVQWAVSKVQRHGLEVSIDDDQRSKPLDEDVLIVTYQSLHEVLFNVLKHAHTNRAMVWLRRRRAHLRITIRDHGAGFEPLVTRIPNEHGCFGLFNIRDQLDLIGGELKIVSVRDKGTLVRITVPLKRPSSEPSDRPLGAPITDAVPPPQPAEWQGEPRIRVLLVDDHRMIREGLRSVLEGQTDLDVIGEASDGETAIELARSLQPDVIVMDMTMPTMNGIEATRQIKLEMPNCAIVGLSVHEDPMMAKLMTEAGAVAYVSKAHTFNVLAATIHRAARSQAHTVPADTQA